MGRNKKIDEDKKYNLKISLNETLLKKIDEIIEKNGDKRSRFIEKLLIEYINDKKSST